MLIFGMLVATAIPLLALYLIHRLDLYSTNHFRDVLLCLAWGILSTQLALLINSGITGLGILPMATVTQRIAPPVEELAKVLIIAYLVFRPRFTYFVDGAIYGFAVGIGFAVVENAFYLTRAGDAALTLAAGRVLSTNLMHGSATAISGIALALARFQPDRRRRAGTVLVGLAAAIGLHLAFNGFVGRFSGSVAALYGLAAAFGLTGALGVGLAIRLGLRRERQMIGRALGSSDRLTPGERQAVDQLADPTAILAPIAERFGPAKAEAVRDLLKHQARLGILHETDQRLPDASKRAQREAEIARLHREMDAQRRRIGAYCMLHLRGIAPALTGSIWEGFAEGADADADAGIWRSLRERLAPRRGLAGLAGTPRLRRWRAGLAYLGLSVVIWSTPRMLVALGREPIGDPRSVQILAQWLATVGLLAFFDRTRRSLWSSLGARLEAEGSAARLRRRLLGKGARMVFGAGVLLVSALVWLGPAWLDGGLGPSGVSLPPDLAARVPLQALAQLWILVCAAAILGRLRGRTWLLTSLALAAELAHRWPG